MNKPKKNIILCNYADLPEDLTNSDIGRKIELYFDHNSPKRNINIQLPNFVEHIYHLPDRIKDLLEIAGYIYTADRSISRGSIQNVEYQSWARDLHFIIKVRDYQFWNNSVIKQCLVDALLFMSGDYNYEFTFQSGRYSHQYGLFDTKEFRINPDKQTDIVLFSGGLDSLTGVINILENTNNDICLISHISGKPTTIKTQKSLVTAINKRYKKRCKHYCFYCNLINKRGTEETQRTRSFLYASIAFALAYAFSQNKFYFFENGITSINFSKRQDLINSRASRTTHPKTLKLLERFYNEFETNEFSIEHPYLFKTKTDILNILKAKKRTDLISSTVSCNRAYQQTTQATHCGECSQCIDRRFAMYAAGLEEYDDIGIYGYNFLLDEITNGLTRTNILDYIRIALDFYKMGIDRFYSEKMSEFVELEEYIDGENEHKKVDKIYSLCKKHGEQIHIAIKKILDKLYDPFESYSSNSFFTLVTQGDYQKDPIELLANEICYKLNNSIPIAYNSTKPSGENELNNLIEALINSEKHKYEREHPAISFALAKTIPDHSLENTDLLIEAKFCRDNTTPSKVTDGIAADIIKYPNTSFILFIVYDPFRKIKNDAEFKKQFESKANCRINIVR